MQDWESLDYEPTLPVSEKSNPITRDIDRAPARSITSMLQACDVQMFQKTSTYQGLLSDETVTRLMEVAERVQLCLQDPQDSLVVLSGCGTSGRLAFLIASGFNRVLRQLNRSEIFSYIIAGGDRALLSSQEAPEDDPQLGVLCLKKACEAKRRVLFMGVSCGLSAPFVAAQLDFCLQHPDSFTPVLLGFNPAHQARSEAIAGCSFTFLSVVRRMQEAARSQKAFLINPVLGPEAVSGSSRMKGGSGTKILLEVVLSAACDAAFSGEPITRSGILQHLKAYRIAVDVTYSQTEKISALMEAAGQSLLRGQRLCYLGWGSLGVLGLVDASEAPPTFGADWEDVRGFVSGGYRELNNMEGDLSWLGPRFHVSLEDFLRVVLPGLTDGDTVLLLFTDSDDAEEVAETARRLREKTSSLYAVHHHTDGKITTQQEELRQLFLLTLHFTWTPDAFSSRRIQHMMCELSTKLLLNAVSTGAHILKGKIYQNHMVDLQVTNSKLYRRASRLLQRLSGRPESDCVVALLKAVYRVEHLTEGVSSSDIITHTRAAAKARKAVPLALLCLKTGCTVKEAESHLEQEAVVREVLEVCQSHRSSSQK